MTPNPPIVPVILSGGSGTRLWPASRRRHPKQLLPLVEERSLFRTTVERVQAIPGTAGPIVVCNEDHRDGIQRALRRAHAEDATLILEPEGRNTAPAVAVAALELMSDGIDRDLLVLPADHVIRNEEAFAEAVGLATHFSAQDHLVTFGITPTRAETGYGYIRFGEPIAEGVRTMLEFKEKPDRVTAEHYLSSGKYLWNSGMFIFRASAYLTELERFAPDVAAAAADALRGATRTDHVVTLDAAAFGRSPSTSIDYAVMERTERAAVVPIHAGWSDVGSWSALWDLEEHDEAGNVAIGDTTLIDVHNSYVRSDGHLVAAVGVDNIVIVDSPDAVLVTRRDRAQDVKQVVDRLRDEMRPEFETDGIESRPWGGFVTLASGSGFRVLRLWIDPGGKTSLQTHDHRSEHWVVVKGVARIQLGETTRLVPEQESVFIPAGELHRLENPDDTEHLEVIEVDIGTYVGEDDITRYADEYGRAGRDG